MKTAQPRTTDSGLRHLFGQVCPHHNCDGKLAIKLDDGKRLKCDNVHCGAVIVSVGHWINLCRNGRPNS